METNYSCSGYHKRQYCKAKKEFIAGHSIRTCKLCKSLYMREWRKEHKLTEHQKKKDIARSYANVYLKRGKIKKESCCICGELKTEMHHNDYNKPLEIKWYCKKCHKQFHKTTQYKNIGIT